MTSSLRDTAKGCLYYEERSTTPPEIRKFRRSTNLEPGRRFQHHGLVDDYQNLALDDKVFGITDAFSKHGAAELINQPKLTELQRINNIKAEKVYRQQNKEPLGRIPDRIDKLPSKFTEGIDFCRRDMSIIVI